MAVYALIVALLAALAWAVRLRLALSAMQGERDEQRVRAEKAEGDRDAFATAGGVLREQNARLVRTLDEQSAAFATERREHLSHAGPEALNGAWARMGSTRRGE